VRRSSNDVFPFIERSFSSSSPLANSLLPSLKPCFNFQSEPSKVRICATTLSEENLMIFLILTFTILEPEEPAGTTDLLVWDEDDLEPPDFVTLLVLDEEDLELLELDFRDLLLEELELDELDELELLEPFFLDSLSIFFQSSSLLLSNILPLSSLSKILSLFIFFFQSSPNSSFIMSSQFEVKSSPTLRFVFAESATGSSSPRPKTTIVDNATAIPKMLLPSACSLHFQDILTGDE
jgi:hypothetical protein